MIALWYFAPGLVFALIMIWLKHRAQPETPFNQYTLAPLTMALLWPAFVLYLLWVLWHDRQELIDLWKNRP